MEAIYSHFSSSSHGAPRALEEIIIRECEGASLKRFIAAERNLPAAIASSLASLSVSKTTSLWHRGVGELLSFGEKPTDHVIRIAIELLAWARMSGDAVDVSFAFDSSETLHIGQHVIDGVAHIEISSAHDAAAITLRRASSCDITAQAGILQSGYSNLESVASIICEFLPDHPVKLSYDYERNLSLLPVYAEVSLLEGKPPEEACESITRALDDLMEHAPKQYDWVTSIVREIVLLTAPGLQLSSSSNPTMYGVVGVTSCNAPTAIAEMLVHEASHQHFFIAKRLGATNDGTDQRLHPSPMVGRSRPLEPLLLAYHALGNMALMYMSMLDGRTPDRQYCEKRLVEVQSDIRQLSPVFEGNPALTALGRGLFDPLNSKLSAT